MIIDRLKQLIQEVHRRSLWQVLGIYVVGGWVVFEVVQTLTEGLALPAWFPALAFVLLLIGLPVVMATAFVQEGMGPTPEPQQPSQTGESRDDAVAPSNRSLFTWRNAIAGGVLAFALWGLVAAGWLLFGDGSAGTAHDSPAARPSLAVLPFDNLSPDPDNAFFAAGIHEEILTQFSKIAGLKLISRTSVLRYQQSDKSLSEIAEELGVTTILEGSVRRAGDEVRITIQLIDAASDEHLWAESYERELSDIFQIQADVATRVAQELKGVLTPQERVDLARTPTENLEAYAYYLRGHEHFRRLYQRQQTLAAADAYERAVELDPGFAAAWARLVQTRLWLAWHYSELDEKAGARAALEHLERLAPESPQLRFARGLWLYYGVQRYEDALREFDVLAELWPGDADVMLYRGALLRRLGHWEEGVEAWVDALELDPANATVAFNIAENYLSMRRFGEAERYVRMVTSLNPFSVNARRLLVDIRLSEGDTAAARNAVDSAARQVGEDRLKSGAWWAAWKVYSGDQEEALELYRRVYRDPRSQNTSEWELGLAVAAERGQPGAAQSLADTLRVYAEEALSVAATEDVVGRSLLLSQLALANAYLGDEETAVGLAQDAVEALPVSRDAARGPRRVRVEAQVYAVVGQYDEAVDRLRYLLSIPAPGVTVPLLRLDPRWDPLRDHPGFQALLENPPIVR